MTVTLHGMTWSHPRGYDPMVAVSARFQAETGVVVTWDKRSLQDFETFPVEELAARYDLIVIDHPHVGVVTAKNCLLPLDGAEHDQALAAIAAGSVGRSYPSYSYAGRQWALPIDAATQVQAYRPDRLGGPVTDWDDVLVLARAGRVALPLRPPHSLMTFFTLAAHLGAPCAANGTVLIDRLAGAEVFDRIAQLVPHLDDRCFGDDPIAVLERMADPDGPIDLAPLIYGYVPYARDGFRERRIAFADMPAIGGRLPAGSALGGTGIAVSARTAHREAAMAFALMVASGPVQRGIYAEAGGQPGHAEAWEDGAVNAATHDFYRATRATLEGAWVRPRHDGYMAFQEDASVLISAGLARRAPAATVIDGLNRRFAASLPVRADGERPA